ANGTLYSDYQLWSGTDSWARSQALAGLFACREGSSASKWATYTLSSAFNTTSMRIGRNGRNYGWPRTVKLQVTMAEPVVWARVALANEFGHPPPGISKDWLTRSFASTEAIIGLYQSADRPAINSFPGQLEPRVAAMYPSIMELMALLEAHVSGIPTAGMTDQRIRLLASWLSARFNAAQPGWPAFTGTTDTRSVDAIRFQAYSALLWAEKSVNYPIPRPILDAIPQALEDLTERDYGYDQDQVGYTMAFRGADGVNGPTKELVV